MLHLNPSSVERIIVIILAVIVVVSIIIGRMKGVTQKKTPANDHWSLIWATSSLIVLFAWIVLFWISHLTWWEFYQRYTYLGIFPAIALVGYMKDELFFIFRGIVGKLFLVASSLVVIVVFYFIGSLACLLAIGVYVFQKEDDIYVSKRRRRNPVI